MSDTFKEIPMYSHQDIADMVREVVTPNLLKHMIMSAISRAIEGDSAARAWVLSYLVYEPDKAFYTPQAGRPTNAPIDVRTVKN